MGARTDAALAAIALAAFAVALVLAEASFSVGYGALGGVGTLTFELLAARDPAAVRSYWERRPVQFVALACALAIAAVGARVAPVAVLSAGIGALVTYLLVLALVSAGKLEFDARR